MDEGINWQETEGASLFEAQKKSSEVWDKMVGWAFYIFLFLFPYYLLPPARPSCPSFPHRLAYLTGAW